MDICFACYWGRVNDDVFETFVNTFSKRSKALLQVHTDDRPVDMSREYGLRWVRVSKDQVNGRRALCKIEELQRVIRGLRNGVRLMVADVDIYFLDDPFKAFEKEFDMAVTTRCHEYRYPINGGVFFFRINPKTRRFIDFYLEQCKEPTWPLLVEFREKNKHIYNNPDWEIGQDFLCAAWIDRANLGIKIVDVGPEYNYCPNTDVYGLPKAREMIENAYKHNLVKVLHLKSELKMCIYDDYMEDAITKRCNGKWNWYESKPAI